MEAETLIKQIDSFGKESERSKMADKILKAKTH